MSKFNPFRAALPYLETSEDHDRGEVPRRSWFESSSFICFALHAHGHHLGTPDKVHLSDKARAYVEGLLKPHKTVGYWLETNCPEYRALIKGDNELRRALLQAYRWRWLNHMADQYDRGEIKL